MLLYVTHRLGLKRGKTNVPVADNLNYGALKYLACAIAITKVTLLTRTCHKFQNPN